MVLILTVIVSLLFLIQMNRMTERMTTALAYSPKKEESVFRVVNVLSFILMLSFCIEVYYTI